jgi:hypothetical protein
MGAGMDLLQVSSRDHHGFICPQTMPIKAAAMNFNMEG